MEKINPSRFDKAIFIVKKLREAGHQAYFAGGSVRDALLGLGSKDYDVATSARPDEVLALFPQAIPVGAAFGVILVPLSKPSKIKTDKNKTAENVEVATFRSDGRYLDGRHPEKVIFSGEKEDALRRDFTINGMFFDPMDNKIIDYVGGREDLRNGIIRTIGSPEQRFKEDYLRLIRGIRFSSQFNFQIESKTYEMIKKMAHLIQFVSGERIRDELEKILTGSNPKRGLTLLDETGMMKVILPEVAEAEKPSPFSGSDPYKIFELAVSPSFELAMSALLYVTGAKKISQICKRLRLSNDRSEKIVSLVQEQGLFQNISQMSKSQLKRFLRQPYFEDHLELYRLVCMASHRSLDLWEFCKKKLSEFSYEEFHPSPLISGNTLIELGHAPGPLFKKILFALEDKQLEGKIATRDEALAWILSAYPPSLSKEKIKK